MGSDSAVRGRVSRCAPRELLNAILYRDPQIGRVHLSELWAPRDRREQKKPPTSARRCQTILHSGDRHRAFISLMPSADSSVLSELVPAGRNMCKSLPLTTS